MERESALPPATDSSERLALDKLRLEIRQLKIGAWVAVFTMLLATGPFAFNMWSELRKEQLAKSEETRKQLEDAQIANREAVRLVGLGTHMGTHDNLMTVLDQALDHVHGIAALLSQKELEKVDIDFITIELTADYQIQPNKTKEDEAKTPDRVKTMNVYKDEIRNILEPVIETLRSKVRQDDSGSIASDASTHE